MKSNTVLKQVNSAYLKLAKFVKTAKKARTAVNPKSGEKLEVAAKPATPIITINEKNQLYFNQEVVDLYGINGLNLTIVNVEGENFLVATNNFDLAGLQLRNGNKTKGFTNLTDGKKFTGDLFLTELRNMNNGYSNNFLLEEVNVEIPFMVGSKKVFRIKLNTVKAPKPAKVKKERVKKEKEVK